MDSKSKRMLIIGASLSVGAAIVARIDDPDSLIEIGKHEAPPQSMVIAEPAYRETNLQTMRFQREAPRPRDLYKQKRKGRKQ